MILHENVAYLVDDARRDEAFDQLKSRIETHPADILAASPAELNEISMFSRANRQGQIEKLVKAAQIALNDFDGDLSAVISYPAREEVCRYRKNK